MNTADFLRRLHALLDGQMVHVHPEDNGAAFHKRFEEAVRALHRTHWWSRTKTPTDNAVLARFNRTTQAECVAYGNALPEPQVL